MAKDTSEIPNPEAFDAKEDQGKKIGLENQKLQLEIEHLKRPVYLRLTF